MSNLVNDIVKEEIAELIDNMGDFEVLKVLFEKFNKESIIAAKDVNNGIKFMDNKRNELFECMFEERCI
tara:strand:- start:12 stop:218 length:207 start_codon:yes stop_codon:yes gene_type:complete